MKGKFLILLCLILFIVSVAGVSATEDVNQTITEDNNNVVSSVDTLSVSAEEDVNHTIDDDALSVSVNDDIIESTNVGTFRDLQKKIDNSDVGSIIILENDYIYDNKTDDASIFIDKVLTINGNGHSIKGDKSKGLFYIYDSEVILNNISLIGGNSYNGGAIFSNGNLEVNNCTFINNYAYGVDTTWDYYHLSGGGAISISGHLSISGCSFVNCSAASGTGAIFSSSGGLNVVDCSFVNSSEGCAIFSYSGLTVVNCSFYKTGRAIYSESNLIVSGCSFVDCSSGDGGAIYSEGNLNVVSGCSFVNCSSGGYGGAVNSLKGNLNVSGCSFVNCSASRGGAISGAVYVSDCSFVNCHSNWVGGAIYSSKEGVLNNCVFVNCISFYEGYEDYYKGDYTLRRGVIYSLNLKCFEGRNCSFVNSIRGDFMSLDEDYSYSDLSYNQYGDDIQIDIYVYVYNGTATGDIIVSIDGMEETLTLNDGFASLIKSNLASGINNVYVKYDGNGKFLPFVDRFSILVIDKTFKDLQDIMNNLSDGAVINLDHDYYLDAGEPIEINKNIIINGNGHKIDGGNFGVPIFNIIASNVSLNNISFVNCYYAADGYGGAIVHSSSGILNVNGCSFVGCSAGGSGGAVYSYEGGLTVVDCSFVSCSAATFGGAVYSYESDLIVSGCSFVDCYSADGGGAVYSYGGGLTVVDCSFVNCYSADGGDAVYSLNKYNLINSSFIGGKWHSFYSVYTFNVVVDGELYLDSLACISDNSELILKKDFELISSFDINANNVVIDGKGHTFTSSDCAFVVNGENVTFKNINFNHTSINSLNENTVIDNCSFVNCSTKGYYSGGAIYFDGGSGVVSGCSFVGCSASDGVGGAVYSFRDDLTVVDCSFVGCSAGGSGGAVYSYSGDLTVNGCSFVGCSAKSYEGGGAVYSYSGDLTVNGCSFVGCSASDGDGGAIKGRGSVVDCSFVNCSAGGSGGAIYSYRVNVDDCSFVDCSAGGSGGAIYSYRVNVDDCSFVDCSAGYSGNAIYYDNTRSSAQYSSLEDSSFVNGDWYSNYPIKVSNVYVDGNLYLDDTLNDISESNTRVYLNKDYIFHSRVTVRANNVLIDGKGHTITSQGTVLEILGVNVTIKNINFVSAKIYSSKLNTTIVNCTFVNCSAADGDEGGAIYSNYAPSIFGCSFVGCSAGGYGGAVYSDRGSVVDCSFVNCHSDSNGGAVYSDYGSVVDCSFVNCSSRDGGAVYSDRGSVVDCSFVNCSSRDGGAVYCGGSVSNCSFVNCSTFRQGGAIFGYLKVKVTNCSFVDCSSEYGGAIHCANSVVDCSFVNCSASSGGAIYGRGSVVDCSFVNCSASSGGAIYSRDFNVSDCIFVNCSNSAIYTEAWIFYHIGDYYYHIIGDNYCVINECSFVNCSSGDGGAVYSDEGDLNVVGCSFIGCSAVDSGGAIYCKNLNLCNSSFVDCSSFLSDVMFYSGCDEYFRISSIELSGSFNIENCTFVNSYVNLYSNKNDASISNLNNSIFINGYWATKYPINVFNSMNISYIIYNDYLILNIYPSNFTGDITLIIDDKEYTSKFNDFSANFNLKDLNHGIYPAKLIFDDENVALPSITFNLHYSNSFKDLNDLINNAKNGSVIDLTEDYMYYGVLDMNSIKITQSITINGNGHTINANQFSLFTIDLWKNKKIVENKNKVDIFLIYGDIVNLNNIKFMNTFSVGGGALYSYLCDLTVNGCDFINCSAADRGGAVNSYLSELNVSDCSFVNCYSAGDGGGAVYSYLSELNVSDCSFVNCYSASGGAVYSSHSDLNLVDCSFVNCYSDLYGGAVYSSPFDLIVQDLNVVDCSFVNCSSLYGCAVYSSGGDLNVSDCSFVNCSSKEFGRGTVYSAEGVLNVSDCSFVNCSAFDGDGGAIYSQRVSVSDCSFVNCSSIAGGAIFSLRGSVSDCSFVNCHVTYGNFYYIIDRGINFGTGGAIYFKGDYGVVSSSVSDCSFVNCSATNYGGAIYSSPCDLTVSDCSFVNCSANNYGGAIYDMKSDYLNFIFSSTFVDCRDSWGFILNKKFASDFDIAVNSNSIDSNEILIIDINTTPKSTGNVKVIIDNKSYTKELINSHTQFKISGLKEGNYDIEVIYYGDSIYHYNNMTAHVKVGLEEPAFSIRANDIYQGNALNIIIRINADATGTVSLSVKNTNYSTSVVNGKGKITVPDLTKGSYDIIAAYSGDEKYSKTTDELVVNVKSTISASDVSGTYGNTKFSATFLDTSGNPLQDSEVKFNVNSKEYVSTTDSEGDASVNIDLGVGSYKITSINPINNEKTTNNLVISKASPAIDITKSVNGDKVVLFANINSATATGNVTFKVNDKDYNARVENGVASLTISDLTPGSYNTVAKYSGDSNHNSADSESIDFTIEDIYLIISALDVTKTYGGSEKLEITLTDQNSNPVSGVEIKITLDGRDYTKTTDNNGKSSLDIDLDSGNYDAVIFFNGNDEYGKVTATSKITINKISTQTTLSSTKYSPNRVTLTAVVSPTTADGDVIFTVNGKDYAAGISDGKAIYTLSNLEVGSYDAKAAYKGETNYNTSTSNSIVFTVEDVKYDVNAPDLTKYYHGPERFVVTVKEDGKAVAGKDVTINLNGANYTKTTNENGEASMAINLNSGEYKVTSEFEGIEVQSTITVKQTVSGENITKIFRNGTQYYATFVDTSGKTLAENTAVEFNINGVFYTRYTNDKGVARMNINLNPGEYVITAKNPSSTEQYTNIITVLPSIVENHDLTKYYRNASQYSLRLLDDKGNPVKAGVEITLNINGVFYKRISNDDGYVKMNINLEPGEYIITADYNGLMASNTIKVLSVIETKNLEMKYKDGSKFESKILDGQGNPYPNQNVTFNINGVFYDKVTDENGIARLAINLMAGEYIITTTYNGLNAANKITISS